MRNAIARALTNIANLIGKADVAAPTGFSSANGFVDAYQKHRAPTNTELLNELKNTAFTCASINSAVCADNPPKLYVRTFDGQPAPKCQTKAIPNGHPLAVSHKGLAAVEEVVDHPLLTLLKNVNPIHNAFDLWELTELFLEVHGSAYWYLEFDEVMSIPSQIWILPSQCVKPVRNRNSASVVDSYDYLAAGVARRFLPEQIIHFRFPDPRDPYCSGLSPLRACYEQVTLSSQYNAMRRAVYENTGIPSVVLSPGEVIPEEERERIEMQWNQKFRKGGMGKVLVAESGMTPHILTHSMGDLAALAEAKATKEDVANAFHVPIPYLTGDTNLANMEAAEIFHMRLAIKPRLRRRDEKINEQLVPLFDPTGRLFMASDDPTPAGQKHLLKQQAQDLELGIRSINEIRAERGLPPAPWGDRPKAE